ncbi:MAG: tRNA (N(6)-L-threonylcarbamoyladenosine(37)-C(2))-methylthiotransferase MtaB [Alphaproteobacteria bacterium]|nr:tRNA (N(6)-L-threonylcarbamoyladenosine(37)-C(2))-methylthiotransferase MtaB [Alphaproteobacteria bacterium]
MDKIEVITFGCRLNTFESEIIRKHAIGAGLENVIIVHTCAVTAEAERQAKQQIHKIIKENPGAKIILTGCSAQNSWSNYKDEKHIFAILGNKEKLIPSYYEKLATLSSNNTPHIFVGEVLKNPPEMIEVKAQDKLFKFDGKTKAFVQIQQGCNNRCAYCVVPLVRGRNQSFSEKSILNQCRTFIKEGYKEIILTGVDISAYGSDTKNKSLFGLVKKILDTFPKLERLRLSSLDPAKSYDQILGLMRLDSRLMPHLHLSIQAGDDKVLSDMRRRHNRDDIITLCKKIHKTNKNIAIGADVIVGFPDESDKEFKNTYKLIKKCGITHLHVFPYSIRQGTLAAKMQNQIPTETKKERAKLLRTLGEKLKLKFIKKQKGKATTVLIEKDNQGYTENYIFVKVVGEKIKPNTIVKAKISKIEKDGTVIAKRVG